ncbi:MAG: family intrarane metalloprotease [Paenibacillus sp.]|jgi:membrane protease YdiL (CAAX protease family)|nr:family intrarane metalloprotease [Paenibacillus sp.]
MTHFFQPHSEIWAQANQGKRLTHPIAAVLISFAIVFTGIVIVEVISAFVQPILSKLEPFFTDRPAFLSAVGKITILWLLNIPIFLLLWVWLASFERRPFRSLGFRSDGLLSSYLLGAGLGLLMLGASVGLALLCGVARFLPVSGPMEGIPALGGIFLVVFGWMVQAAAEETLYRGWLLQAIGVRSNVLLAVLLSSLCFATVHSLNNGFTPLVLCNLILFGIFLSLYRIAGASLWSVCAWHAAWNWALGNLAGADVSGGAPEGGRLLHISLSGPEWLTGGAFGLEGSVAVTVVFLIGIVCLSVRLRRKR